MSLIEYIKENPRTTAAVVVAVIATIIVLSISLSKPAGFSSSSILSTATQEAQVALDNANAALEKAKAQIRR